VAEARLPGDVRAWFLIDTGAGKFTLFDASLSSALALRHELVRDPLMPSISYSASAPFLEIDSMGRRNLTVHVAEGLADRAELADLDVPVQGVLGTHFFRGHCLWIDWGKREFTAMWPRVRHARHVALPLRYGVGGELHATIRINGIACDALIDTGSAETLLSTESAERLSIRFDSGKLGLHLETAIGVGAVRDGVLQRLALGTEELTECPVLVVERRIPNADLILGTDVLSHWGTILDFGERPYLVLDPLAGKADPSARERLPIPEPATPPAGGSDGQGVPAGGAGGA
jgi:predicted aspartyl protease